MQKKGSVTKNDCRYYSDVIFRSASRTSGMINNVYVGWLRLLVDCT